MMVFLLANLWYMRNHYPAGKCCYGDILAFILRLGHNVQSSSPLTQAHVGKRCAPQLCPLNVAGKVCSHQWTKQLHVIKLSNNPYRKSAYLSITHPTQWAKFRGQSAYSICFCWKQILQVNDACAWMLHLLSKDVKTACIIVTWLSQVKVETPICTGEVATVGQLSCLPPRDWERGFRLVVVGVASDWMDCGWGKVAGEAQWKIHKGE